jgi:hypothetical protein
LGYVSDNEKLVKVTGLSTSEPAIYDPGTALKRQEIAFIPEWLCKLAGIIVGSLAFDLFLLVGSGQQTRSDTKNYVYLQG